MLAWLSVMAMGAISAAAGAGTGWAVARWLSARAAVGLGLLGIGGLGTLISAATYSIDRDGLAWATVGTVIVLPAALACATMGLRKLQRRRARRSRA